MDFIRQNLNWNAISTGYDQIVDAIIRPPRANYDPKSLGPTEFSFPNNRTQVFKRIDIELKNKRGLTLQCSHFVPFHQKKKMPCVIYCHGNSGCRLDGLTAARNLLGDFTVFVFDFAGCGISEGEYISLGYYEKDDLATIVEYLRSTDRVTRIGLWGRSMGAATSIMYANMDPGIAGMVLDSPFQSLHILSQELVQSTDLKIPSLMVSMAMKVVRSTVMKKANFDIDKLCPIEYAPNTFIPAMFVHGKQDYFIKMHHTEELAKKYAGDHTVAFVEGDHNSVRPSYIDDSISIFFHNCLKSEIEEVNLPSSSTSPTQNQSHNVQHQMFSEAPDFDEDEDWELQQALKLSMMGISENKEQEPEKSPDSNGKKEESEGVPNKSANSQKIETIQQSSTNQNSNSLAQIQQQVNDLISFDEESFDQKEFKVKKN